MTFFRCIVLAFALSGTGPAFGATAQTVPVIAPKHTAVVRKRVPPGKPAHTHHIPPKPAPPVEKPAAKPPAKPVKPPLPADVGPSTGLHLPRYAALKSDEVNMRTGPGARYPVQWVYKRRDLPVEIEREFDVWRLVEDSDGVKGWVHQATITGKRSFAIAGTEPRTLRATASDTADAVAVLKPGVIGRLRSCDAGADWCQVQVDSYRGWLKRTDFWGATPGEVVQP